jgi:hypothetical protein
MDKSRDIGNGLARVRARKKRERLARVHEVRIEGDRVIIPVSLFAAVMGAVSGQKKRGTAGPDAIQMRLVMGEEREGAGE